MKPNDTASVVAYIWRLDEMSILRVIDEPARGDLMAKKGQHRNDAYDPLESSGNTNPSETTEITAGTPKKQETYEKRAREHKDPAPVAQRSKPSRNEKIIHESSGVRARKVRSGRSGSDSGKAD